MLNLTRFFRLLSLMILLALGANSARAQTSAFTYQGKLSDTGAPANGQYDFRFRLFDMQTVGTGTQQGSDVLVTNVTVTAGIFTAQLDFGVCASCFDGSARFLELAVKQTSGSTFTTLGPRQQLTSTPYAVRSLNTALADGLSVACVNCVTSAQIGSVNGSAVTGAIPVASLPAGSANYVQNTASQQSSSNFNISGNGVIGGTMGIGTSTPSGLLHARGPSPVRILGDTSTLSGSEYVDFFARSSIVSSDLGGMRIQRQASGNIDTLIFAAVSGNSGTEKMRVSGNGDVSASIFNATTQYNLGGSRVLSNAGNSNLFAGMNAGTTGSFNSFFGQGAGQLNTTGANNSFFGQGAGNRNTTGGSNAFFGTNAGANTTTSSNNSFFGNGAGANNATGGGNTFVGVGADFDTAGSIGDQNSVLGYLAKVIYGRTNATAIGSKARVDQDNVIVLGSINGINGATASTRVGIGMTGALYHLDVLDPSFLGLRVRSNQVGGTVASFGANGDLAIDAAGVPGGRFIVKENGNVGISTSNPLRTGLQLGSDIGALFTVSPSDGSPNAGYIRFGDNTGWKLVIGRNRESSGGALNTGFVGALITIQDNGRVGIGLGAIFPRDVLEVEGDIRAGCLKSFSGTAVIGSCASDARLKRDIRPFPKLLDKLVRLQPVHFYWETKLYPERGFGEEESFGLVAQEVEKVMPELVAEDKQGFKVVHYHKLPLLMLQAVKELKEENDSFRQQFKDSERQAAIGQDEITRQRRVIEGLQKLVCHDHSNAEICK